jgi:biopolymer transport protein ExbD
MRRKTARQGREPTIALINIVFLMLIFFLVAGTLAAPLDKELKLVSTARIARTVRPVSGNRSSCVSSPTNVS